MGTMMDEPLDYFRQWIPQRSEIFYRLEEQARKEQIPIVGPVVGRLLHVLARLHNAQYILELGTATGYSTLYLAQACQRTGGRVVSLEADEVLVRRARENIADAGLSHWVEVHCEDARDALTGMDGPVDMIFMDIEKEDYHRVLPSCARLMPSGGLLVADNTGFKDAHAFNRAIFDDTDWEVINLWSFLPGHSPEFDGLCIALKI